MSAESIVRLHQQSSKAPHIVLRFHYVRQEFLAGTFTLKYIQTDSNTADILTKLLGSEAHQRHAKTLLEGFGGIPPTEIPALSEMDISKKNFAKMRAAKQRILVARRDKTTANKLAPTDRLHEVSIQSAHQPNS
jgi:hypothetical protein